MTGRTQANGNSMINLNSLAGSVINGDTVLGGVGQIHYNLAGTQWFLSGDSQLSSLAGNGSNIHLADPGAASFRTLSIESLGGSGQTFWLNTLLDDGSSQQTDKLIITNTATGTHQLHVSNAGGVGAETIQGIDVVDASTATTNTAQ